MEGRAERFVKLTIQFLATKDDAFCGKVNLESNFSAKHCLLISASFQAAAFKMKTKDMAYSSVFRVSITIILEPAKRMLIVTQERENVTL